MFLGQPRHCICTNASRGLSPIAEFLASVAVGCSSLKAHAIAIAVAVIELKYSTIDLNKLQTLSVRFNGHFPGEPGLASVY